MSNIETLLKKLDGVEWGTEFHQAQKALEEAQEANKDTKILRARADAFRTVALISHPDPADIHEAQILKLHMMHENAPPIPGTATEEAFNDKHFLKGSPFSAEDLETLKEYAKTNNISLPELTLSTTAVANPINKTETAAEKKAHNQNPERPKVAEGKLRKQQVIEEVQARPPVKYSKEARKEFSDFGKFQYELDQLRTQEVQAQIKQAAIDQKAAKKAGGFLNHKNWFKKAPKPNLAYDAALTEHQIAAHALRAHHATPEAAEKFGVLFGIRPNYLAEFEKQKPGMIDGIMEKLTHTDNKRLSDTESKYLELLLGKEADIHTELKSAKRELHFSASHQDFIKKASEFHQKVTNTEGALDEARKVAANGIKKFKFSLPSKVADAWEFFKDHYTKNGMKPSGSAPVQTTASIELNTAESAGNWIKEHKGEAALIGAGVIAAGGWAAHTLNKRKDQQKLEATSPDQLLR
jgi:hypothetical protein